MNPETRTKSRSIIPLLLLSLLLPSGQTLAKDSAESQTAAPTLETLFLRLARQENTRVGFVETKSLSVLSQPIKQEGILEFRPPNTLAKHVAKPVEEHYVIENTIVTVSKPGESASLQLKLSDYPALEAFAEGLRAPLSGNLETLRRYWKPSLGGSWRHWLLALVPVQPELASLIRSVRLEGENDHLTRMTLEETNGDQSTLDFMRTP